jgi:hypothetical protein
MAECLSLRRYEGKGLTENKIHLEKSKKITKNTSHSTCPLTSKVRIQNGAPQIQRLQNLKTKV